MILCQLHMCKRFAISPPLLVRGWWLSLPTLSNP